MKMILVPSCRKCPDCTSNDYWEYCDNEELRGPNTISKEIYLGGEILPNCPLKNAPEGL